MKRCSITGVKLSWTLLLSHLQRPLQLQTPNKCKTREYRWWNETTWWGKRKEIRWIFSTSEFYWQHTLNPKSFYVFALLCYQKYISSRGFINQISTRMQWLKRVAQIIETKWQKPGSVNSKSSKGFSPK